MKNGNQIILFQIFAIIILWYFLFVSHMDSAGLKMDSMTYSVIAKNIVRTGEWKRLHYSKQAYENFYQHPPMGIWMQAIVFHVFGISDVTAKIFPVAAALLTIFGVYVLGVLGSGAWFGFLGAVILMLSSPYPKYASDFILDGPLACWLVWGVVFFVLALRAEKIRMLFVGGMGICFFLAFMTKGLVKFLEENKIIEIRGILAHNDSNSIDERDAVTIRNLIMGLGCHGIIHQAYQAFFHQEVGSMIEIQGNYQKADFEKLTGSQRPKGNKKGTGKKAA